MMSVQRNPEKRLLRFAPDDSQLRGRGIFPAQSLKRAQWTAIASATPRLAAGLVSESENR